MPHGTPRTLSGTSREAGGAFKLTTDNPVILGHEFCAEVIDFGPRAECSVATGSLVCSVPVLARQPMEPVGYSDVVPGGFAEYMLLSETLITPVPSGTDAELAALTEPMAVGYHAVNKAKLSGFESILVLGCGPVGLAVITALKGVKTGPVIAADFSAGRRALAEKVGADEVIDPGEISPYTNKALRSRGETVIFECIGVPGIIDEIFLGAPQEARIVVVGVCLQTDHMRPLIAINKELNIQFVLGYSVEEFVTTLRNIASGEFDVAPLITDRASLAEVPATFDALATPNAQGKVLVKPWD